MNVPARTYPGTKGTFSHDCWFVDILQVEAVTVMIMIDMIGCFFQRVR